ncbi:MAG TPA: pilus assembly protein [Desulfobulbaceae bacterium]|nr:pilus assembly protein [Desulfobulbaceae bacterium]
MRRLIKSHNWRTAMFKSEKGVSAVEFALIAPLLFVLTFGIVEFGLLLFDKAVITNASREAARAAIVYNDPPLEDEVIQEVIEEVMGNYTDRYLISLGGGIPPTIDPPTYVDEPSGRYITVNVRYTYSFLVFQSLIALLGGSEYSAGIPLAGTTVMRMEFDE